MKSVVALKAEIAVLEGQIAAVLSEDSHAERLKIAASGRADPGPSYRLARSRRTIPLSAHLEALTRDLAVARIGAEEFETVSSRSSAFDSSAQAPSAALSALTPPAPMAAAPQASPYAALRRDEKIRLLAAGSPFPLPEGMADRAILAGQDPTAFALEVAQIGETERRARSVAAIDTPDAAKFAFTPTGLRHLPAAKTQFSEAEIDAVARRIAAA